MNGDYFLQKRLIIERSLTWLWIFTLIITGQYVFPSTTDKDKVQAPSNMCRAYRKILKMAGIKSSIHILRQTNITNLITNGTDIKTVKNRAGHTRVETTLSYTHPDEEFDKKAAEIFDKYF